MENTRIRNRIIQERTENTVAALVRTVKFACAVAELDDPGCKQAVLDALIGELEELAGRKKVCVDAGGCQDEDKAAENASVPAATFGFGPAIEMLKQGKSVARKGWNGKNQYVELASCISYKDNAGEIVNAHHNAIGNKALAFVGTSGVQLGWLASQADMLAEDWYVVK